MSSPALFFVFFFGGKWEPVGEGGNLLKLQRMYAKLKHVARSHERIGPRQAKALMLLVVATIHDVRFWLFAVREDVPKLLSSIPDYPLRGGGGGGGGRALDAKNTDPVRPEHFFVFTDQRYGGGYPPPFSPHF